MNQRNIRFIREDYLKGCNSFSVKRCCVKASFCLFYIYVFNAKALLFQRNGECFNWRRAIIGGWQAVLCRRIA